MKRVSADDLEFAATWLEFYDDSGENGDHEGKQRADRVAAWLRAEVERRMDDAIVRRVAATKGVSSQTARAALRRTRQRMADH